MCILNLLIIWQHSGRIYLCILLELRQGNMGVKQCNIQHYQSASLGNKDILYC